MFKWLKKLNIFIKIGLSIVFLFTLMVASLAIYASNSYEPLDEMYEAIEFHNDGLITVEETSRAITYEPALAASNVIIIPGGLVEPESYAYLAYNLATGGSRVTIVKPLFNLAIISPNQAKKYIDEDLTNILVGHSLGGVIASMVAHDNESIDGVVLLASYPTKDITDKSVLMITASNDLILDQDKYEESLAYVNNNTEYYEIEGGNHAQFGWYGEQDGDGEAEILPGYQQYLIINEIFLFISSISYSS